MQSRNTYLVVTSVLLLVGACARQNAGAGFDDGDDMADESGGSGGSVGHAGSAIVLPGSSGTTTTLPGTSGKGSGGTTALPPAGSGGKTSTGGKTGAGGKTGTGGKTEAVGGDDTGPINMPIVGLSVTFAPDSKADPSDFIGGELDVINDTAQPLALADLKIRYYFSNEITAATPTVMMNWAQFGAKTNLGGATCVGTLNKAATPKAGADSYIELTCSGASGTELKAGTMLKISWKAGAQASQSKFIQSDDWSFSDPSKIVVLNGNTIVWGIDPE